MYLADVTVIPSFSAFIFRTQQVVGLSCRFGFETVAGYDLERWREFRKIYKEPGVPYGAVTEYS